jgi:hypothetical protein
MVATKDIPKEKGLVQATFYSRNKENINRGLMKGNEEDNSYWFHLVSNL